MGMNDQEYQDAVASIPHLNLTPYLLAVPHEEMLREVMAQFSKISPFEYGIDPNKNQQARDAVNYLREAWQGFCVVDITKRGDHMIDYFTEEYTHEKVMSMGVRFDENGHAIYGPTDVGEQMPTTIDYIYKMIESPGKTRLSKLGAGKEIGWHCHAIKGKIRRTHLARKGANRATIHIPLICNDFSTHTVTKDPTNGTGIDADQLRSLNFPEYKQHYKVGEVWMFNSIHYHKAENRGPTDRYHMLIYFDHMDPLIRPIIEEAIKNYTGPTIK
jgi:hypothetical protein